MTVHFSKTRQYWPPVQDCRYELPNEGQRAVVGGLVAVAGASVAVASVVLYSLAVQLSRQGLSDLGSLGLRTLVRSVAVTFWAVVGAGIGGYVTRETGV